MKKSYLTVTDQFCGAVLCYNRVVRQDIQRGAFATQSLRSQPIVVGKYPVLLDSTSRCLGGHAGDQRHGVFTVKTYLIQCHQCGTTVEAKRPDRKFCSTKCSDAYHNARRSPDKSKVRICKWCGAEFPIGNRGDANRRYCSRECAKNSCNKQQSVWHFENPDAMSRYNENRVKKDPDAWKRKDRLGRAEAIQLLGGKCIVCGASNPNWLHIDFIPTQRGLKYRHPRHIRYIREHLGEFRLLCANHHYELTLTGKIEGTDITQ